MMVHDLLWRIQLEGTRIDHLVSLLGAPDKEVLKRQGSTLTYYLGPEPGMFGIDSELLVIDLDFDRKVVGARIRTD